MKLPSAEISRAELAERLVGVPAVGGVVRDACASRLLVSIIARMAQRDMDEGVERSLRQVLENGGNAHFKLANLEGTPERRDEGHLFVAIWESGSHRR